jgi:hypothetical protein
MNEDGKGKRPLWRWMLEYTILCVVAWVLLWPMLICGCHFHPTALAFAVYPITWGFVMLAIAKQKAEWIVAWCAFAFSVLALWAELHANSRFFIQRLLR